jgi:RNA polymerase sigma-70 factor, ECF subfamily
VSVAVAITDLDQARPHHDRDADLLVLSAKGNRSAFSELVERLYPLVFRVVWRLTKGHADTEDIAQEAFVRLWKHASELREVGAMKAWLIRVASNLALDRYRGLPMQQVDEAFEVVDDRPQADQTVMSNWAQRRIDAAIHTLPERQRLALTLVHFEHLSSPAAAEAMEISIEALESLLSRARRALKEKLAADKADLLSAVQMEGH